jgi:Arc/MetJ family transcription regulator
MATTKRLVAIDDQALKVAQAELGTRTIKDTVNTALQRVADGRSEVLERRLETLASLPLEDRERAWR